jgi:hypothetical protein
MPIVILNVVLVLLFVSANYAITNVFNSNPETLFSVHWTLGAVIEIVHAGTIVNGSYVGIGGNELWLDYPMWIFLASTVINMAYIIRLLRKQE